jgi:hypothetical protein
MTIILSLKQVQRKSSPALLQPMRLSKNDPKMFTGMDRFAGLLEEYADEQGKTISSGRDFARN